MILLDHRPVLVENRSHWSHHQSNTGQDAAHQPREWRWAKDIDEETVSHRIGLIARLVLKCVIEDKELIVLPVVSLVTNLDIDVLVVDIVDVV